MKLRQPGIAQSADPALLSAASVGARVEAAIAMIIRVRMN
jgi:hypothetical protein